MAAPPKAYRKLQTIKHASCSPLPKMHSIFNKEDTDTQKRWVSLVGQPQHDIERSSKSRNSTHPMTGLCAIKSKLSLQRHSQSKNFQEKQHLLYLPMRRNTHATNGLQFHQ